MVKTSDEVAARMPTPYPIGEVSQPTDARWEYEFDQKVLPNDFAIGVGDVLLPFRTQSPEVTVGQGSPTKSTSFTASDGNGGTVTFNLWEIGGGGEKTVVEGESDGTPFPPDVKFYKAAISGFDGTTANPGAAGWIQITGVGDLGQSATELVVIDNGLIRVAINKNANADSQKVFGFDGVAWYLLFVGLGATSTANNNLEVTAVEKNTASEVRLALQGDDDAGGTLYSSKFIVKRGLPVAQVVVSDAAGDHEWRWATIDAGSWVEDHTSLTAFYDDGAGAVFATDAFGDTDVNDVEQFMGAFRAVGTASGIGYVFISGTSPLDFNVSNATASRLIDNAGEWSDGDSFWLGFAPLSYGLGDGGGADVGNGDGQFREAEDNFTDVVGGWVKTDVLAGNSNEEITVPAPANGDAVEWDLNFPIAGEYYIGVMCISTNGTVRWDATLTVDGAQSETQTMPTALLPAQENQLLFGPITIATAGDHTIRVTLDDNGATADDVTVGIDFLAVYPYQATASTPTSKKHYFPKNLANTILTVADDP